MTIHSKPSTPEYRDGWEIIWGKQKEPMKNHDICHLACIHCGADIAVKSGEPIIGSTLCLSCIVDKMVRRM